ncbi:MAG: endo alpha-1,4 polygalactosaminidase [Actinomycetota bacterium]|nr:endo alpha-1,4 polygalactosaminidase [Actinomycetota bacterium]
MNHGKANPRRNLTRTLALAGAAVLMTLSATPAAAAPLSGSEQAPPRPARWVPQPGTSWQWQLQGELDLSVDAEVFDVDAFDTSAADVAALHAKGRKVICYVSVGSAENWRPDHASFPASVLGRPLDGWPGERWLDIRRRDVLRPILGKRFDLCRRKGFDAVEPDNMDAFTHPTGFPLTAADQLAYNRLVARIAHRRGLSVGLKNDLGQVPELVRHFDFAVNEQCVQYDECGALRPFLAGGKAVFHAEYGVRMRRLCRVSSRLGLSSIRKAEALGAARRACP